MKKYITIFIFLFLSCSNNDTITNTVNVYDTISINDTNIIQQYDTLEIIDRFTGNIPKYIFLFIGDGMGINHVKLADRFFGESPLVFDRFNSVGLVSNDAYNRDITGSAASATALATGYKTSIDRIAMDSSGTMNFKAISKMFKEHGKKVGIVTSTNIDNATPGAFYANNISRFNRYEISLDIAKSRFDYFAGGKSKGNSIVPENSSSIEQIMIDSGYTIIRSKNDLNELNNQIGKVWVYENELEGNTISYEIDRTENLLSLEDLTVKGIELLDNDNGFFIMVEGGKIDFASHENDVVSAMYEVKAFNDAISKAYEFYESNPDSTLIIITADHETGGLSLGYTTTEYDLDIELFEYQNLSLGKLNEKLFKILNDSLSFNEYLKEISLHIGLGDTTKNIGLKLSERDSIRLLQAYIETLYPDSIYIGSEERYEMYGGIMPYTITPLKILANKAGVDWSTFKHTAMDIPIYAIGQGEELFNGRYENFEVADKIIDIMDYTKEK